MKAWRYSQLRAVYHRFRTRWATIRRTAFVLAILCDCALAVPARAQQQQPPEDPENEKRLEGSGSTREFTPAFQLRSLSNSNSMRGSTSVRRTSLSTSECNHHAHCPTSAIQSTPRES